LVITKQAAAGTLESSDIRVAVFPGGNGLEIHLTSSVERQYGGSIRESMRQVAESLGVENAVVEATDQGALDCTIRARTETAFRRAGEEAGA
jgi:citrate lyase subunit gamma (acyl carrier protein)